MGKRAIVVDTNILVSALGWRGNSHRIMSKIVDREITLFISYGQFDELAKVLEYPKFKFTQGQKARFKALISKVATFVNAPKRVDMIREDPSDNMILDCALVANADYIVSGDHHLLDLKKLGRTRIVSASSFLRGVSL